MKWARRHRARLRAALRAALGAWNSKLDPSVQMALDNPSSEVLTIHIPVKKRLLADAHADTTAHVARQAYQVAEAATRERLNRV